MKNNIMNDIENDALADQQECSICICDVDEGVTTNCNHTYCKKCIEMWLETGNTSCPLCNGDITDYKNYEISYKIVKIESRNTNNNRDVISAARANASLINKVILYKFYSLCLVFLTVFMYNLLHTQYYESQWILNEYNLCMANNTNLVNILNNLDDAPIINVIMTLNGESVKKCPIPENYYINC